jgi:hypothetical protein
LRLIRYIVRIEEPDMLRFSVFEDLEIIGLQTKNRLIVLVTRDNINENQAGLGLKFRSLRLGHSEVPQNNCAKHHCANRG